MDAQMTQITSSRLRAQCDPTGARLAGLWLDDWPQSLVLGPADAEAGRAPALAFFGVLVGPVANRVSQAAVEIDGVAWSMAANEGTTSLHSGPEGLHGRTWNVTDVSSSDVTYALSLPHGACGLPGHRTLTATYRVEGNCLELVIEATTDTTTVMNVAHHPYWNLSGARTIADHRLQVEAEHVLDLDTKKLPTGNLLPVGNTDYDFRQFRKVPTDRPIDSNLCLSKGRSLSPRRVAELKASDGPRLVLETTEPGLQVYNGYGLGSEDVALHKGQKLRACAGLALEPQAWPDAPSQKGFPSILLTPGEAYRQVTRYHFH